MQLFLLMLNLKPGDAMCQILVPAMRKQKKCHEKLHVLGVCRGSHQDEDAAGYSLSPEQKKTHFKENLLNHKLTGWGGEGYILYGVMTMLNSSQRQL